MGMVGHLMLIIKLQVMMVLLLLILMQFLKPSLMRYMPTPNTNADADADADASFVAAASNALSE